MAGSPAAADQTTSTKPEETQMAEKPGAPGMSPQPPTPSAKRAAPAVVADVTVGDITYRQAGGEHQRSGFVEARRAETDELLWTVRIYEVAFRPELETDVQEVYFTDMSYDADANALLIGNERGERFSLDLDVRKVTPLP